MKLRLKINWAIIAIISIMVFIFARGFFRQANSDFLDEFSEILGLFFMFFGQIIRISARGYKSEHSQNGGFLITTGPYSLVRNPMYLGIFLICLGAILLFFKWWTALIFLLFFITRYVSLIISEEKKLLAVFPKEYAEYQKTVPRIIPGWNSLAKKDIGDYLYLKLQWCKKESNQIIAVLFIALFLESFEDILNEGWQSFTKEIIPMVILVMVFVGLVLYLLSKTKRSKDVSGKSNSY